MRLVRLEIAGFKSFAKKSTFEFAAPISAVVGPNGSGKSNVVESIRFVTGEQSIKTMRGKKGEDLIWNGSQAVPRAATGKVTIVFDNTDRSLPIDFNEVTIAREVARDGANAYYINDSQVRLRDIYELLSAANIGASSHHIISQGEADRILSASAKERKAMLEDALGLRIYQWKILESKKKLEKTGQNIKEVESLRREIAPHIKYLQKQVEKIAETRTLRENVKTHYREYLKREAIYLDHERGKITKARIVPEHDYHAVQAEMKRLQQEANKETQDVSGAYEERLQGVRSRLSAIQIKKDELARSIGRLEGMIELIKNQEHDAPAGEKMVRVSEVLNVIKRVSGRVNEALSSMDWDEAIRVLEDAANVLRDFEDRLGDEDAAVSAGVRKVATDISRITAECEDARHAFARAEQEERTLREEEARISNEKDQEKDALRSSERTMYELKARLASLETELGTVRMQEERFARDEQAYKEQCAEAQALTSMVPEDWESFEVNQEEVLAEKRSMQEDRRKALERLKIKLEDMGAGGSEDAMKEYEEITERDKFLEHELGDLRTSATSLSELIEELSQKIEDEFKEGIKNINKQFQEFFILMFGGGTAGLSLVKEVRARRKEEGEEEGVEDDEKAEEGVEIAITLPHKKVKGLVMLSGGERALTSIALLFAVSQVNPPPFLVLDETDAALDEANSRKYGDMLENLARVCQLVVITHNRETMSRAGILYGVTMGKDATSKVLSVKFEEAAAIAK
jgi:chromosome segregation protein